MVRNPHPVVVYTDHANLQYYWHLQKINWRVARYVSMLTDYNIELKHLPSIKNRVDPFSRRPDFDDGSKDNEEVVALPDQLFIHIIEVAALDEQIGQKQDPDVIKELGQQGHEIVKCAGWWKG